MKRVDLTDPAGQDAVAGEPFTSPKNPNWRKTRPYLAWVGNVAADPNMVRDRCRGDQLVGAESRRLKVKPYLVNNGSEIGRRGDAYGDNNRWPQPQVVEAGVYLTKKLRR